MVKKNYPSRSIRGKRRVNRYLAQNTSLRKYVPVTVRFSIRNLTRMAQRYSSLYIKPDVGSLGIGVHKLIRRSGGYQLVLTHKKRQLHKEFSTASHVYRYLKASKHTPLIIQQSISLDKFQGRPYDLRAMVQRKPGGPWVCTGIFVKIGGKNRITTNYYQGGQMLTYEQFLQAKGYSSTERSAKQAYIKEIAIAMAKTLSKKRSGMQEMGIDLAFDKHKQLWVIEVNTYHPQFHPLKKIAPSMYRRMMRYARSYGRTRAK